MFDDNILAAGQNALLLLNAVDYLAGSQDLLGIRSKTLTQRVIKPVDAKRKDDLADRRRAAGAGPPGRLRHRARGHAPQGSRPLPRRPSSTRPAPAG